MSQNENRTVVARNEVAREAASRLLMARRGWRHNATTGRWEFRDERPAFEVDQAMLEALTERLDAETAVSMLSRCVSQEDVLDLVDPIKPPSRKGAVLARAA